MNQEQPIGSDQQGLVSARRRSEVRWELKSRVALTRSTFCQGYWACLLFGVQRSSVGSERGVVVLNELSEEVLDEV